MSTLKVAEIRNASSATGGLSIAADGVVSGALPYPNRNLVYNGAMQVHQRGTSTASITSAGYYTADRWFINLSSLGTWTQSVESDAPTGSGFRKSLKMLCTTADAAPSSSDILQVRHIFEGQDVQRVAKGTSSAQQLTLSFWVKSNVTGTYIAELADSDNDRTVSASYSVSASATWEKKTITFPADTTGALDNDNAASFIVQFYLGVGSNFTSGSLATSWAARTNANRAVGQTNLAAATNNYWQVTGVQLEVGPVATPFEFKSYGTELRECQRYYYLLVNGDSKTIALCNYYSSSNLSAAISFPVTMRTGATTACSSGTNFYIAYRNNGTDVIDSLSVVRASDNATLVNNGTEASGTAGQAGELATNNAAAFVAFSAEL